jgi:hypothetical protein
MAIITVWTLGALLGAVDRTIACGAKKSMNPEGVLVF